MYDLEFGEGEDFTPTAENLANAAAERWGEGPRLAWWETCSFAKFLRHLQECETQKGITWNRGDAYCAYARGRV